MAVVTYNTLVSSIVANAENPGEEFTNEVPYMIDRAERRLTRDLDNFGLVAITTVTASGQTFLLPRPENMYGPRYISWRNYGTNRRTILEQRTLEYIQDYWPDPTSGGDPQYYGNWDGSKIYIAPATNTVTEFEFVYYTRPSALNSATQQTNWFTEQTPHALFYACMVEANAFMKNAQNLSYWQNLYQESVQGMRGESRRTRRDDVAIPMNPAGGENTL